MDTDTIRRSNKIYHKGRLVKYPFENDLASLDARDRDYCLSTFLDNPHENIEADTMLKFFMKTFGEGITKLYLEPYNRKLWKFDPDLMDTQIVDRIPKPPKEDIVRSAKGIPTEGYPHQLHFQYPKYGGIQQLVMGYKKLISDKSRVINSVNIKSINKQGSAWHIETDGGNFSTKRLINCMPLHELFRYITPTEDIRHLLNELKYNSIYIAVIQAKKDNMGQNFALYFADSNIIFHRLSKLNFLGESYCLASGGSTIMAEITYRSGVYPAGLSEEELMSTLLGDLEVLKIVNRCDIIDTSLRKFEYAYVVYDLMHRKNTDSVLRYIAGMGIDCCGRFAEFEYINMDKTVEHSMHLAKKINEASHE